MTRIEAHLYDISSLLNKAEGFPIWMPVFCHSSAISTKRSIRADMDRRVETALQLMKGNLQQQTGLSDIAACVNLSASRLSHLFKTETGVSPAKYLKRARMERAKQLLETSFLSVKQIMVAVGINDSSHFVRSFKNAFGLTPTDFRSGLSASRRPSLHVTARPVATTKHIEHHELPRVANLK